MNIIQQLQQKGQSFLIVSSQITFADQHGKEYHIVVSDNTDVEELDFEVNEDIQGLYERKLSSSDVEHFKNNLNSFKRVYKDKNGRIYEPIKNNFK